MWLLLFFRIFLMFMYDITVIIKQKNIQTIIYTTVVAPPAVVEPN